MEEEIKNLVRTIMAQMTEEGFNPSFTERKDQVDSLLCVDGRTKISLPAMLRSFFSICETWTEAIYDQNILDQAKMESILQETGVRNVIERRRENFRPHPPAFEGDEAKTVLFAFDHMQNEETYFWWRHDVDSEPFIVDFSGGMVVYHPNLLAYLRDWAEPSLDLSEDLTETLLRERVGLEGMRRMGWEV